MQASIAEYKEGLGQFRMKYPKLGQPFMEFTSACFAEGALSEKQKHLVALGISVYSQDEYCIMYHADAAMQLGATADEVFETVGVCAAFGGGAALSQGVTLVQDVVNERTAKSH